MTGKIVLVDCIEAVDWEIDSGSYGHKKPKSRVVERESRQVMVR
jgi:hypothetical protein